MAIPTQAQVEARNHDSLEETARRVAARQADTVPDGDDYQLPDRLEGQEAFFRKAHAIFSIQAQEEILPGQAAEWLLDNFYVVIRALRQILEDMPRSYYRQLPKLQAEPLSGHPRIYALARELLRTCDAGLDLDHVKRFVTAYQELTPLTMGELWALPTMLRVRILEVLSGALAQLIGERAPEVPEPTPVSARPADEVVAHCIMGLRLLDAQDWNVFVESISMVEQILAGDPTHIYACMDFETRDMYRKVIEELGLTTACNEVEVAEEAIRLAQNASQDGLVTGSSEKAGHVGFYLLGDGRVQLEAQLGYRPDRRARVYRWFSKQHPTLTYIGSIGSITLVVLILLLGYASRSGATSLQLLVTGLLALIPAVTLAVCLVNWLILQLVPPRSLPKLEFEDGIPAAYRTMVVVPSMLTNADEVDTLLLQLELHFLRNTNAHITFALLTDFSDAPRKHMPGDGALLTQTKAGIRTLNERYGKEPNAEPFYLFHRERLWNSSEGFWMGWERKRGKLEEFGRLLLGESKTSYIVQEGALDILPHIRFILTLDADTILPQDGARRLIGTLAHLLNHAEFDPQTGRVIKGYTVLQPRTEINPASASQSRFSQLYGGDSGLDLYSLAASDTYQDLFGEGLYTGKGIYDLEAFARSLKGRIPENALLSHDLFEGIYGRAGLVNDVIVYEEYPPNYLAYAHRSHRWIRGDWQLLPWLLPKVPQGQIGTCLNSLPLIDRWKIVDNLRRSLVTPALLALLVAGWIWLPGTPMFWTSVAVLILAWDLFNSLITRIVRPDQGVEAGNAVRRVQRGVLRWLLGIVFLVHGTLIAVDAIATVFVRMFITHKRLLQWTTAAHTVRLLGKQQKIAIVWREMYGASALVIIIASMVALLNPSALLVAIPFLFSWLISPQVALWSSRPVASKEDGLTDEQLLKLRCLARRTWLFFERFVGPEDHWLAPDHFQEEPRGLVAHRTSPTNIGLMLLSTLAAYDMGYIGLPELCIRLQNTLTNLEKLDRYWGHFLNWYDTRTLEPLSPRYVSTVDSGNLAACLLALRQSCLNAPNVLLPRPQRRQGVLDTLAVLKEILDDAAQATPEAVAALRKQRDEIQRRVLNFGDYPDRWSSLSERLIEEDWPLFERELVSSAAAGLLETSVLHSLRFWSERVHYQLNIMRRELNSLMPWLAYLQDPPEMLKQVAAFPTIAEAWQAILEALPVSRTPVHEIPAISQAAQVRLAHFREQLIEIPESPEHIRDAYQWSTNLTEALALATEEVTQMLDDYDAVSRKIGRLVQEMNFGFLYDSKRRVFHIGYNVDAETADANYYDLLASEARLASLVAIAKGDIPQLHWLHLGRPLTQVNGNQTLLSWSGTMFEYLMPVLLTRLYRDTLLTQSVYSSIEHQINYAREKGVPWGISESGYYRFDANMNYQYRAFGAPGLGFKRGLEDDLVISPYASLLALPLRPQAVMQNIERLTRLNMLGDYGFYEAVDFTSSRLALGLDYAIVRSFMIHHQGMILLSLVNTLLDKPMVRRFHTDRRLQSVELLLQEKIPQAAPVEVVLEDEVALAWAVQPGKAALPWTVPARTPFPLAHYLSNGRYGLLITNAGGGYSRWQGNDLTRWRADTTRDDWGTWIYVQDLESQILWSTTLQPAGSDDQEWEVTFAPHKVDFRCTDPELAIYEEITVAPEDDVEIRRVRVTNHGHRPRRLALTTYGEIVLGDQEADRRHPAFNKLFVESEYLPETNMLIFRRRPRAAGEQALYMAHTLVTEPGQYVTGAHESDRSRFLGRGGTPRHPVALNSGAMDPRGSTGAVLDPILALSQTLELKPHSKAEVAFLILVAGSRDQVLSLAERYQDWTQIDRAFSQALSQSELELRRLDLTSEELERFQKLFSLLTYPQMVLRAERELLAANVKGQSGLWPYAISGDYPILLACVENDSELGLVREVLKAHHYWRNRGLKIDLVILNGENGGYDQELQGQILRLVDRANHDSWLNRRGGIFVVQADRLDVSGRVLLATAARVILYGDRGTVAQQLESLFLEPARMPAFVPPRGARRREATPPLARPTNLRFDNGWGGFSEDGREYNIYLQPGDWTPAPWVNVVGVPNCGFLVSETGGGYCWALNSGENRLTPWSNDPVRDRSGEALYLRDEETAELWSPTPLPAGENAPYLIRHGAGYTIFEHHSHGLTQRLRLFASRQAPVKVLELRLQNAWRRPRRLLATYYAEWVLGVSRDQTQQYVIPEYDATTGSLLARNPYNEEFGQRVAFVAASQEPHGLTADRTEFLGRLGNLRRPAALGRIGLASNVQAGLDPCAAVQLHIDLQPGEAKQIYFLVGQGADRTEALKIVRQFRNPDQVAAAWQEVTTFWDDLLGAVTVQTPDEAMNLMLNRWLLYQNLSCRIWGRSGFYQSSGAYGFRDQLQDVMSVVLAMPEAARAHILRAASRQFEAGDVLHWWHPPSGRGVRTRIADDLLWLPYVTAHYVKSTGDASILQEKVPFLQGPSLGSEEEECYGHYDATDGAYTIYEHCRRAIKKANTAGPHGLPLMGAGDWNDGMNRVGIGGLGESVWLGWFYYATLQAFVPICEGVGDEEAVWRYRQRMARLRDALHASAWDGAWYLRAFYDDGLPLGSQKSLECQISSIAQSWAVISGAGSVDRVQVAMASFWDSLVRVDEQLVLLFAPPFDNTSHDPGYIRGYPPGIRENGGQYTHAATWAGWAFAISGRGDEAEMLFRMLNPINHTDSQLKTRQYQVEPYVVAADIYSLPPHHGRGGWTWYTGSAGWLYRLGLEAILGLRRQGDGIRVDPCIPKVWSTFLLTYRCGQTTYRIKVENPEGVNRGVRQVLLDHVAVDNGIIKWQDDGREHQVLVLLGQPGATKRN